MKFHNNILTFIFRMSNSQPWNIWVVTHSYYLIFCLFHTIQFMKKSNFSHGVYKKIFHNLNFSIFLQSSAMVNASPGGAIVVTATGATPFATPTSTVCSGAPPRQPFPNTQYGPPPGTAIIPVGGQATPTPSSHGPSPTPSSGSGGQGGFGAQPPGYPNRQKYGRMRGNTRQPLTTPPASPAKNRGKGKFDFFFNLCYSHFLVFCEQCFVFWL